MNYFNYYTEIEEEFVRRRGSHMLVSSLDWALIDSWKQREVPLHIVLRGINNTFDSYDKRPHRDRKVNNLFFCQQEVEAGFRQYLESRVGESGGETDAEGEAGTGESTPFAPEAVRRYLDDQHEILRSLADEVDEADKENVTTKEALARAAERLGQLIEDLDGAARVSYEALESDLTIIEKSLLEALHQQVEVEKLAGWEKDGKRLLRSYRETMTPEAYRQTFENYVGRRLREEYQLPRLSLFYLNA